MPPPTKKRKFITLEDKAAWGELCAVANEIPDGLSVHEFVCADEGVVVHEEVTDEAIVSSVCEAGDPDEQRPEQPEKTTSPQDVLNAFDTIRSFFGEHDDDVAMDHFLEQLLVVVAGPPARIMARVPERERILIVELAMKEYTQRQITAMAGRSTHTVNRTVKAYREEKRICDAPH
ncbi:hypothetical protein HPB50_002142 [Hyalomma asiaticum]|uniref:Uncharacterized protein n=1 Tax=Hyalomma asiaticum TaxID=266040 RepID=A0ACB7RM80_HYAAI|nr:hypothetical protein HPB50_002142 [Hyalomma asiaticum]